MKKKILKIKKSQPPSVGKKKLVYIDICHIICDIYLYVIHLKTNILFQNFGSTFSDLNQTFSDFFKTKNFVVLVFFSKFIIKKFKKRAQNRKNQPKNL
jgi:hypothetical protein